MNSGTEKPGAESSTAVSLKLIAVGLFFLAGIWAWAGNRNSAEAPPAPAVATSTDKIKPAVPSSFDVDDPKQAFVSVLRDVKPGNRLYGHGKITGPLFCSTLSGAEAAHELVYGIHPNPPDFVATRLDFMRENNCLLLDNGDTYTVLANDGKTVTVKASFGTEFSWLFP